MTKGLSQLSSFHREREKYTVPSILCHNDFKIKKYFNQTLFWIKEHKFIDQTILQKINKFYSFDENAILNGLHCKCASAP